LHEGSQAVAAAFMRQHYTGTIIAAGGFDGAEAEAIVDSGDADFVAFARWFSSNPDLPERLRNRWPLTPYRREAFWGGDEQGYSDFLPYRPAEPVMADDDASGVCSLDCVQCGLRGPAHAMPCLQHEGSHACLVS
jgi:N-ethylmaleimide reductase